MQATPSESHTDSELCVGLCLDVAGSTKPQGLGALCCHRPSAARLRSRLVHHSRGRWLRSHCLDPIAPH
eukprot:2561648-Amphidinium_carterae.1